MRPHGIASAPLDVLRTSSDASTYTVPSTPAATLPAAVPSTALAPAHAVQAAACAVPLLGASALALARVLASRTQLELRVVGSDAATSTLLFTFPAPVVPHVGLWDDAGSSDLHVLAVTSAGYVYRLCIPVACLVRSSLLPPHWAHEHRLEHLADQGAAAAAATVHMVDAGLLLVACIDGTLVRVQQPYVQGRGFDGAWREALLSPASFSLRRLFARSPAAELAAAPTHALAIASHVRESDTALAFTVCRDRKLRVWNVATDALVRTVALPTGAGTVSEGPLLDAAAAPHVALFYPDDGVYSLYVLVYVPGTNACLAAYGVELEDSSSWSGGVGEVALVWTRLCDAHAQAPDTELRDMQVVPDAAAGAAAGRVWLLWHTGGAPLLQTTLVTGLRAAPSGAAPLVLSSDEPWTCMAPYAPYTPLHGPELEAALAEHAVPHAALFLPRLCEPGRFSRTTLHAALAQEGIDTPVHERTLPALASRIAARLEPSSEAWLRFTRRVEQLDRAERWPLRLCLVGGDPWVVSRHALGAVHATPPGVWLAALAQRLAAAASHPDRPGARRAGEAASAEYAGVVNALARQSLPAYEPVRAGGARLLQCATLAAEALGALGARAPRLVDAALERRASVRDVAQVPPAVRARCAHLVREMGADAFVREAERLVALGDDGATAPTGLAATTAVSVAALLSTRLQALRALLVLVGLVSEVPALAAVRTRAWKAWRDVRARHVLATASSDHAGAALLVHDALGAQVPLDSDVRTLCAALLPRAPSAVLACLSTWDDAASRWLCAQAAARLGRAHAAWDGWAAAAADVISPMQPADGVLWALLPAALSPAQAPATRRFYYWREAAASVEAAVDVAYRCYAQALQALEDGADVPESDAREVWTQAVRAQLALHMYEAASASVLAMPFEELRMASLTALVTALCEASEVGTLLRLDLLEWQPHVERTLSFQARHAAPLAHPPYFHVLYAYHMSRGDYKSAAASMYQHAHRLRALATSDEAAAREGAVRQAQSFLAAINALSLLPPAHAWFADAPAEAAADGAPAGPAAPPPARALRGVVTQYLPRRTPSLAVVQLADVRREYHALLLRLELMRTYPELAHPSTPWRAEDAMHLFVVNDDFDAAWAAAQQLSLPLDSVVDVLAQKCMALERAHRARVAAQPRAAAGDAVAGALVAQRWDDEEAAEPDAAFLQRSARAVSWPGRAHERAWRYLLLHLDMAAPADALRYRRIVAERLVAADAWDLAPAAFAAWFHTHAPDVLLRVWMRAGALEAALRLSLDVLASRAPPVCVPYTLMDSVLAAAERAPDLAPRASELRDALRARGAARAPPAARTAAVGGL
ncbi:Uncharacterized protein MSYG_2016 [Malassezia sympodialis ATCC 42132]|uniref:Nuclear pore complex protein Nup160 n=1 Tax=Malassezia sympodialis (strain ATCC 42132) TaxID=1230383 RepID=A0A1M8A640_MALS4|nr:Uncharacterized protein MSYG_2016 [Malassezia sympodialis ATCC 42132]